MELSPKAIMEREEADFLVGYYDRKIAHIKSIRKSVDFRTITDDDLALSLDVQLSQLIGRRDELLDRLIELLRRRKA